MSRTMRLPASLLSTAFVALTMALLGAPAVAATAHHGAIFVANRGSGTVSVIDVATRTVIDTLALPAGDGKPEPMYVYYSPRTQRVFVGDRGNDRVVVFDAHTYEMEGTAPAGDGVFHMWGGELARQLWVNNDVDDTTTVIDMQTLDVITTVSMPSDLVAAGGKPHDVILSPFNFFAYVTIVGVEGEHDYVVQYLTFFPHFELNRAAVGKDAHVSATFRTPWLYVPCQDADAVYVLNRVTLEQEAIIDVPGAHGAGMTRSGRYFYTTNLPGGGSDALYTIDTQTLEVIGEPVDTPYGVPHNIALTPNGRTLYVTHSGPNDTVTIYETSFLDPTPVYVGEVTVGMNPFGLAYVR